MLHVFYRACAVENNKPRPPFYSKVLCLESCLRALRLVPEARFTLIHDGAVPQQIRQLVAPYGETIELPGIGEAQSFVHTLKVAATCDPDDLLYFVEDDYLHAPEALIKLCECYEQVPCDYLTLFDDPLRYKLSEDVPPDLPLPDDKWYASKSHHWRTIESTTLTFGGAARLVQEDAQIFSIHVLRRAQDKRYIADREAWRELQGLGTYATRSPKRRLVGAIPSLAAHCEVTALPPAVDWAALAASISENAQSEPLAIDGGRPAKSTPPPPMMPGVLALDRSEQQAVLDVLRSQRLGRYSNPWSTKSHVELLEAQFKDRTGSPYCLAVSSGTAALHCSLVGLGIGPGDEVIVPAYTWIGSATSICNAGAVPVIADIDETLNLDPQDVERRITPYTRAIMVVHMRGASARMDAFQALAEKYRLQIIEDAAQAMGASYQGRHLGSVGDAGCFSLQAFKMLNTGEGGLLLMKDEEAFYRALSFHGIPPDMLEEKYHTLSTNYKMSELTAAVGVAQLEKLDGMLERNRRAKRVICEELADLAQRRPITLREVVDPQGDASVSATIFLETPQVADQVSDALAAENIGNFRLYRPGIPDYHLYTHWGAIMHQRPLTPGSGPWKHARRHIEYLPEMCPRALDLLSRSVDINIYHQFTEREQYETVTGITKVITRLT